MTEPVLSVAEHLERLDCTPHVRRVAEHIATLKPWVPTQRTDLKYVGLTCRDGGQIAIYVNRGFLAFALDDPQARTYGTRFGARLKVKAPTSYVEVFDADLERSLDLPQLLKAANDAYERNLTRGGHNGRHGSAQGQAMNVCPTCFLARNALDECDDHGRQA